MDRQRIRVGKVVGVHGVRGELKVKAFTEDPHDVAGYGPVADETGTRRFVLATRGAAKDGVVIATIDGVADRSAAEALRGLDLYVDKAALPAVAEGEFYATDLVGLAVVGPDGAAYGRVERVLNFGAGDLLEVAAEGASDTVLIPFTHAAVPDVDVANGRVMIDPGAALPGDGPAIGGKEGGEREAGAAA
jgi:16S rRNA processing protein RimM